MGYGRPRPLMCRPEPPIASRGGLGLRVVLRPRAPPPLERVVLVNQRGDLARVLIVGTETSGCCPTWSARRRATARFRRARLCPAVAQPAPASASGRVPSGIGPPLADGAVSSSQWSEQNAAVAARD